MGLISPELNDRLDNLVAEMFYMNRVWDAALSKLNVDFVMSNFESTFHSGVAHKFPLIADKISEIQSVYNNITTYKATPQGRNDYGSPLDFFEFNLEETIRIAKMISATCGEIDQFEDMGANYVVRSALLRLSRYFAVYVNQAILLKDKAAAYGMRPLNIQLFDKEAESFLVVPSEIPSLLD